MKFLVISRTHGLLPFAYRLRNEGHDVQVLIWKKRFERSWDGKFEKLFKMSEKTLTPENLEPVISLAEQGELVVVTDVRDAEEYFSNAQQYLGTHRFPEAPESPLRLGFWFDGETVHAPHLLICDIGAWPGGLGTMKECGMTLARLDGENEQTALGLLQPVLDPLKSLGFKGLAQVGLVPDHKARFGIRGMAAGWPWLHTHAFLAEMAGTSDLMCGEPPVLNRRYTTALPVSLPFWPSRDAPASKDVLIDGLTPKQMGQVFWHDVTLDTEKREVRSAGLDGLIGVAHGSADTHPLSQARALAIAGTMRFPEKQYRPDVGVSVPGVLANMENTLGIVL